MSEYSDTVATAVYGQCGKQETRGLRLAMLLMRAKLNDIKRDVYGRVDKIDVIDAITEIEDGINIAELERVS